MERTLIPVFRRGNA